MALSAIIECGFCETCLMPEVIAAAWITISLPSQRGGHPSSLLDLRATF